MLAPATPTISGCKQGKCLSYLPDCMGGAIANCMGGEGVVPAPFEPPLTGDTPFKILPVQSILHIYGKGEPKNHQLFQSFSWAQLSLTPNTDIWSAFVMLRTHSKLHRGQMSHVATCVCDISPGLNPAKLKIIIT